jgi:hypothetical protein
MFIDGGLTSQTLTQISLIVRGWTTNINVAFSILHNAVLPALETIRLTLPVREDSLGLENT